MVNLYQSVGGGTGGEYYLIVLFCFLFVLLSFVLSCLVSFLSE